MPVVKHLLAERKHVNLATMVIQMFPGLFRFQQCGVLFVDFESNNLFKFDYRFQDEQNQKPKVLIYPQNVGCTGQAIERNKIIFYNKGERLLNFVNEIDNSPGLNEVESYLVAPICDYDGKLRGVIQLINRLSGSPISEADVQELEQLTPALGEILKTAEEVRDSRKVSSGVNRGLLTMRDSLQSQLE